MEYLYLGKIVNTHGIKGEVRILSDFKYKEKVFIKGFPIYIGKDKEQETITSYRPHKQFCMITMAGLTNINEVLKYKGKSVYIKRGDLQLQDGEYLNEDLVGMAVFVDGQVVGKVKNFRKDPYQDKIVVNKEGIDYLVPFVRGIIKTIDLKEHSISLENIKGLLD